MIQEKDFLYRVPVKNVLVTTPNKYIRNPEILIDIEGGEFMHGNILDANSTNKLINQSVKDAIDKDNSITDKIDNLKYMPYVSKNNMSSSELGDFTEYQLGATNFIISAMHGSNDARTEFDFGEARFISVSKKSSVDIDYESVTVGNDNNIRITNTGIRKYINRNNPSGSATEAFSTNGGVIDTTAFALKSELDSYAKKTDIPEVSTSDFVSKTTTDNQSIKSGLNVSNNLNVVDGNNESLIDLSIYNTPYDTHTNSSIAVKSFFDGIVDGEQTYQKGGCMIEMVAGDQRNPYILISTGTENSYTGENEIRITKSGISQKSHMYDGDTNYYFAANGTVNDIYNTYNKDIYRRFDDIDTSVDNEGIFVSSWNNLTEETEGVRIKNSGISITNGSQNEVFATDGSIADLTKYIKIGDAYKGCIPYYNKYTESEIQRYQLADKEGIELSSYGTRTKLLGTDIAISSGSEDLKLTRSGIYTNSYGDTSNHFYVDVNSQPRLSLYDDKCAISAKIFRDGYARIGIRKNNYGGDSTYDLKLSADGIEMLSKTTKDIVTANNSTAHIGLDDDQTEYTYVAPLENGKVPVEYLDLSQYVLKSVYDEKIAALESRIAALEANHTTE